MREGYSVIQIEEYSIVTLKANKLARTNSLIYCLLLGCLVVFKYILIHNNQYKEIYLKDSQLF